MLYILKNYQHEIIGYDDDLEALRTTAQGLGGPCDIYSVDPTAGEKWVEECNEPLLAEGSQWAFANESFHQVTHRMIISKVVDELIYYLEVYHTKPEFTTFHRRCSRMDWQHDLAYGRIRRL